MRLVRFAKRCWKLVQSR